MNLVIVCGTFMDGSEEWAQQLAKQLSAGYVDLNSIPAPVNLEELCHTARFQMDLLRELSTRAKRDRIVLVAYISVPLGEHRAVKCSTSPSFSRLARAADVAIAFDKSTPCLCKPERLDACEFPMLNAAKPLCGHGVA